MTLNSVNLRLFFNLIELLKTYLVLFNLGKMPRFLDRCFLKIIINILKWKLKSFDIDNAVYY